MKKTLIYITVIFLLTGAFAGCKKMDSTFKQYVVPGGLVYTAKVTSPIVYTGRNRIKIAWLRGADPSVTKTKIYWNSKQDSVIVATPATGDTISVIIPNLEEKQYNFVAITYDDKGHSSVPVELLGESFGDKYDASLLARPVVSSELDESGNMNITWAAANTTGGAYATDVQYTDVNNKTQTRRFLVSDEVSTITDYKIGTPYQYRTVYIPDLLGIDSFYTPYITQYVAAKIKKAGLVVTADSFAATSQLPLGGPAKFAFDDDISTFWHTHHTPAPVPPFPHWLMVDMVKTINVTRVELTCRPGVSNTFTEFTMQGSMDGKTWTSYDSFTLIQKDPTQSFVLTGTPKMRYIRIYATKGPNAYANLAEFSVFGYE